MSAYLSTRDARILSALDVPRSAREIADKLRLEVCEAWADERGYEIEWGTDSEPVGARLVAITEAEDRDEHAGLPGQVYARLISLERRGLVQRIQLDGHRPMLWQALSAGSPKETHNG